MGISHLFNWEEIGNDLLITRLMARWQRRRRRYILTPIVFCLSNGPSINNLYIFVGIRNFKISLVYIIV